MIGYGHRREFPILQEGVSDGDPLETNKSA